ncbi:hypothetical protein [Niallia sp. MER TA 168]|uniref:hypothetical protein n=1 Tax=Niallia sp. MER TA 168 TaxID=2939568 RepID=UPI002040517F|nr:hypothetical protein [Niallia sp. MER TA 168]MCM3361253.1 hypothetical protein [Niallia sp. MER TA 168]
MFIDTNSREAMLQGICNYFGITTKEVSVLFDKAGKESRKESYLDGDIFNNIINDFIDAKMPNTPVDQVLFFHLGRRLNSNKSDYTGKNLYDLLSIENETTKFLKNHGVEFFPIEGRLELVYKGEIISLLDSYKENVPYLRWRLGHNVNRIDYCFNGFMLKDLLYKNHYARDLFNTSELISVLAQFLNRRDIVADYYENSTYYCFEYCCPLKKILFDSNENLSFEGKQRYLLNRILQRLYDYSVTELPYMFDHDNPIIRLKDNDTMDGEYFISIEEITKEMLM